MSRFLDMLQKCRFERELKVLGSQMRSFLETSSRRRKIQIKNLISYQLLNGQKRRDGQKFKIFTPSLELSDFSVRKNFLEDL